MERGQTHPLFMDMITNEGCKFIKNAADGDLKIGEHTVDIKFK